MMTNHTNTQKAGSVLTRWALRTYDVWGNARDGYEINDTYDAGVIELRIPQTRYNVGVAWHACHNPECPANNPCGHTPQCPWGAHRRESHGVIPVMVTQYDHETHGMQTADKAVAHCPECDAIVHEESQEFIGAAPSDRQIKRAFGVTCRISTSGDDLHITVDRERDGLPIGEMTCISHASLSPVRKAETEVKDNA